MQHLYVTCAIIVKNNKILAAKRSLDMLHPGFWEFPGGKIEDKEKPEETITREIKEELNCDIEIQTQLPEFTHLYPDKIVTLIPFHCTLANNSNEPLSLEHEEIQWLALSKLDTINWLEADIPIQKYIYKNFKF